MALRLTPSLIAFFRILRWQNLIMVAGCLLVFHLVLRSFEHPDHTLLLDGYPFLAFVLTALCITASGYLINDHFDRRTDAINRPGRHLDYQRIAPLSAMILFTLTSLAGLLLAIWVAWELGQWQWLPLYPLITGSLVIYSVYLKGAGWWGNLWVALLSASLHWVLILADLTWLSALQPADWQRLISIFAGFSVLAFLISLFREIVKDMEDLEGDLLTKWHTGVVRHGLEAARLRATIIGVFAVGMMGLAIIWMPFGGLSQGCLLLATVLLIRMIWLLQSAQGQEAFHQVSRGAKWVLLIGLLAVLSL